MIRRRVLCCRESLVAVAADHDPERFIPQIDGLRFVAISSVALFHVYAALERGAIPPTLAFNTDLAKRGVELFFAISGFILGVPFASHYLLNAPKVDPKRYFLRRLTRLEPPYFLSLFAWAGICKPSPRTIR